MKNARFPRRIGMPIRLTAPVMAVIVPLSTLSGCIDSPARSGGAESDANPALAAEVAGAPAIQTQPSSQSVIAGEAFQFTVTATGTAPLAYQWMRRRVGEAAPSPISGANAPTYSGIGVPQDSGARISCMVSNAIATATSRTTEESVTLRTIYEAEKASVANGANVRKGFSGYSGTGYVAYPSVAGGAVTWSVWVKTSGSYTVTLGYALASGIQAMRIDIGNGMAYSGLSFTASDSWRAWKARNMVLPLQAGENKVKATATADGGINIDYLKIILP